MTRLFYMTVFPAFAAGLFLSVPAHSTAYKTPDPSYQKTETAHIIPVEERARRRVDDSSAHRARSGTSPADRLNREEPAAGDNSERRRESRELLEDIADPDDGSFDAESEVENLIKDGINSLFD